MWLPGNCCANPFSDEDSRAADPGQDTYRLLVLNPTPRDPSPSLTKPDTQDLVDGAMMTSDLVTLALAPLVQRSIPTNVFSCIQDMGEFWLASSGSVVSVHTYAEISPSWNVQMTTHWRYWWAGWLLDHAAGSFYLRSAWYHISPRISANLFFRLFTSCLIGFWLKKPARNQRHVLEAYFTRRLSFAQILSNFMDRTLALLYSTKREDPESASDIFGFPTVRRSQPTIARRFSIQYTCDGYIWRSRIPEYPMYTMLNFDNSFRWLHVSL